MKDYKKLVEICLQEIKDAGITPGNITAFKINTRAKRRWGMCTYQKDGTCEIQIAAQLLTDDRISEKSCKETIIHEILHSCKDCQGHTGRWGLYARHMNNVYGYHIKRTTSAEEKGIQESPEKAVMTAKYVFRCKNCGQIIKKTRACNFTKYYQRYGCGICGGKSCFEPVK